MRRTQSRLASAAIFAGGVMLAACAGRSSQQVQPAAQYATADTIGAQLADLELKRIARAATAPDVASSDLDAQIAVLHDRVRSLPHHVAAERSVTDVLLRALTTRQESLAARLIELRQMYTDTYPTVRQAAEEERLVNQRRIELRASTVGGRDAMGTR